MRSPWVWPGALGRAREPGDLPMMAGGDAPPRASHPARTEEREEAEGPTGSWNSSPRRAARQAGHTPARVTTRTTAMPPRTRTSGSKARPGNGSATPASPTGVRGDTAYARAIAPKAPANPTTTARPRPTASSSAGRIPRALSVGLGWHSRAACRASPWDSATVAPRKARPARIHHPTTCG
jgi:hypothetical protein